MRYLALPLAMLLVACGPTPPAATPSAEPSAVASPAGSAAPSMGPWVAPTAGPAEPNVGTFAYKPETSTTWLRTEKGAMAGQEVVHVTLKLGKLVDGKVGYEVIREAKVGFKETAASGAYEPKYDPYSVFIDVNLNPVFFPDTVATKAAKGEEVVTVPAGTFACTRSVYHKDKGGGAIVDITVWENGAVGLVKAQVSNMLTVPGASATADIRYELEKRPG